MKALAITHKGLSRISALEVKEILGFDCVENSSSVIFDSDILDLCRFCYSARSIRKIVLIFHSFPCNSFSDLTDNLTNFPKSDWFTETSSFGVRCWHETDMNTLEIEKEIGAYIHEHFKSPVDLSNPELPIFTFIDDGICYIGLDIAGFDLSKRGYFLFSHPTSLKGTIAYSLSRFCGFSADKNLVDIFSKSGNIAIEAALFAMNMSCHYYNKSKFIFTRLSKLDQGMISSMFEEEDKKISQVASGVVGYDNLLRNIKAAQKNAKIAGINKEINFIKGDIDWIDTKFSESSVDCVIAYPPQPSQRIPKKPIEKSMKEFFYQLDYILKKESSVVIMTHFTRDFFLEIAQINNFKLKEELSLNQGKEPFIALKLEKA